MSFSVNTPRGAPTPGSSTRETQTQTAAARKPIGLPANTQLAYTVKNETNLWDAGENALGPSATSLKVALWKEAVLKCNPEINSAVCGFGDNLYPGIQIGLPSVWSAKPKFRAPEGQMAALRAADTQQKTTEIEVVTANLEGLLKLAADPNPLNKTYQGMVNNVLARAQRIAPELLSKNAAAVAKLREKSGFDSFDSESTAVG